MDWYVDVDVIVAGVLDNSESFYDPAEADAWIEQQKQELEDYEEPAEIYILVHEHDEGLEDCSCSQYLTDHSPLAQQSQRTPLRTPQPDNPTGA